MLFCWDVFKDLYKTCFLLDFFLKFFQKLHIKHFEESLKEFRNNLQKIVSIISSKRFKSSGKKICRGRNSFKKICRNRRQMFCGILEGILQKKSDGSLEDFIKESLEGPLKILLKKLCENSVGILLRTPRREKEYF